MLYSVFVCDILMDNTEMKEVLPSAAFVQALSIPGYRLAFCGSAEGKTKETGLALPAKATHMNVWGVVYTLDEIDYKRFEQREQEKVKSQRLRLQTENMFINGHDIIILSVSPIATFREYRPTLAYGKALVKCTLNVNLPQDYRDFVREIVTTEGPSEYWDVQNRRSFGLIPHTTDKRQNSKGMYIIGLKDEIIRAHKLGSFAVVRYGKRSCLARVVKLKKKNFERSPALQDPFICAMDQNLREALELPKIVRDFNFNEDLTYAIRRFYDNPCKIFLGKPKGNLGFFPLVQPRTLLLTVNEALPREGEKKVCTLSERNIELLGLEQRDYLEVIYINENNEIRKHAFRVYKLGSEVSDIIQSRRKKREEQVDTRERRDQFLPSLALIHSKEELIQIDREGREALGIKDLDIHEQEITLLKVSSPVLVRPSISKLFSSRLLVYGFAFFLNLYIITYFAGVIQQTNLIPMVAIVLAITISLGVTFAFCIFDIRGKVQY